MVKLSEEDIIPFSILKFVLISEFPVNDDTESGTSSSYIHSVEWLPDNPTEHDISSVFLPCIDENCSRVWCEYVFVPCKYYVYKWKGNVEI